MEPITEEAFTEWKGHPVTQHLMKMLKSDREMMKEGMVNNAFDDEAEVRGRCKAVAIILDIEYEDLK